MMDKSPAETGAIARDFGIPVRGRQMLLSVVGRRMTLQRGLFPDAEFVLKTVVPDLFLINSPSINYLTCSVPVLRMSPGFLRTPPVLNRPATMNSATLSRVSAHAVQRWPERVMAREGWLTPALARRAEAVIAQIVAARVGGGCWAVAPVVAGAKAAVFAGANADATWSMLRDAVRQNGAGGTLLVMRRPGRIGMAARRLGVAVLDRAVDPWPLIEQADRVYAPSGSEAGLLAVLLGKPLGPLLMIDDRVRHAASALLLGTRYVDPFTGAPSSCEAFLDIVSELRRKRHFNTSVACCVGISFWKRRHVAAMLGAAKIPAFRKTAEAAIAVAAKRGGGVAVWPSRAPAALTSLAAEAGVPVMRIEDGFVRSVGLGADFLAPLSLVLDRLGIYYDATGPSELERLLAETEFGPELLRRAAALRQQMVVDRVTKYNLPSRTRVAVPSTGRVILVPGQVSDDRSVRLGGGGVRPGLDLLRRVRDRAPEAHILYKPHPDVDAGHRHGAVPDHEALQLADQIVRGGSMADLLGAVHEVHTLTSLAGFEALLREKPVTTYGRPFYAGWGLTTDLNPPARRTRRLELDALVAATMILYPRYIDPVTLLACGPEVVLERLRDPALHRVSLLVRARRAQGRLFARARGLASQLHASLEWKQAA